MISSKEIFGIVVRSVGLVLIVAALVQALAAVAAPRALVLAVPLLLLGLWLLRGAPAVVAFAFPDESDRKSS